MEWSIISFSSESTDETQPKKNIHELISDEFKGFCPDWRYSSSWSKSWAAVPRASVTQCSDSFIWFFWENKTCSWDLSPEISHHLLHLILQFKPIQQKKQPPFSPLTSSFIFQLKSLLSELVEVTQLVLVSQLKVDSSLKSTTLPTESQVDHS